MNTTDSSQHDSAPQKSRVIQRTPFFYGWTVLGAATFGMMMTTPGQTLGVSVFLDPIIADLGVSRSTVSLLYTFGTLAGAFSLPFVGRFIDRRGPRVAVVAIAGLFALACVFMGLVQGLGMLLVGFLLIRGLGQGSLSLVSLHVINLWFVRRRGFAIGLSGLGMALATAFFPLLIETLLGAFGWRGAYMLLGGLVAVTILPIGWLLYRSQPERYGEVPDGRVKRGETAPVVDEYNATPGEAKRTPLYWLFIGGDVLIAAFGTGLVFHHYDLMAVGGLERVAAAAVFVPFGLLTAAGNFTGGVLMDRISPKILLSAMLTLQAAALVTAAFIVPALLIPYGVMLGITQGIKGGVTGSVYAYYFGRQHLGAIKGFAITLSVAGTAAGPFLFALGKDLFGGYVSTLLWSALPVLLLAVVALLPLKFLRPPERGGVDRSKG
ncbi:MAG: MFS transporter [Trueperaceae bacterium]|nr:MFS transporter [Trueperaceae bacterium]